MGQNTLLADECGLGKTITASAAFALYAKGPILIVCPISAKLWWESVLAAMYPNLRIVVAGPGGNGLPVSIPKRGDVWIIHPEVLRCKSAFLLAAISWDIICVDEAHRFKTRTAKQTISLWKLPSRLRWALTATPYGRNPADMWALLHWLYPKDYRSYWGFTNMYTSNYWPPGASYSIVKGARNLDQLAERISPFYIHRTKSEVSDILPAFHANIPVEMTTPQAKLYRQAVYDHWIEVDGTEIVIENALVECTRLQQIAVDPMMLFPSFVPSVSAKRIWLDEWLDDHPDESVVITSRFRYPSLWMTGRNDIAIIMGGMKGNEVQEQLKKFNTTGKLFGTIESIGETLNLQRARNMIVLDGAWSPIKIVQVVNRVHRIGTVGTVNIMYLQAVQPKTKKPTIDHIMRRRVTHELSEAETLRELTNQYKEFV